MQPTPSLPERLMQLIDRFGLILEHSFVQIDGETVFQKADPTPTSKVEIIPISKAVEPYARLKGFEITRHVPRFQF